MTSFVTAGVVAAVTVFGVSAQTAQPQTEDSGNRVCFSIISGGKWEELRSAIVLRVARIPPQGEYETTAAYNQRLENNIPASPVILSIQVEPTAFEYDADLGILTLRNNEIPEVATFSDVPRVKITRDYLQSGKPLSLNYDAVEITTQSKSRVGWRNSARLAVKVWKYTGFGLAWFHDGLPRSLNDLKINVVPDQAKSLRGRFRMLVVGKPIAPYVAHDTNSIGMTFAENRVAPFSWTKDVTDLVIQPICAALYESRTNRVYRTWTPKEE